MLRVLLMSSVILLTSCAHQPEGAREVASRRQRGYGFYLTRSLQRHGYSGEIRLSQVFRNPQRVQEQTAPFVRGALVEINKLDARARGSVDFFYQGSRLESLMVFGPRPVQHVYVTLNVPTLDIGSISLRFNPREFSVNSITLLMNEQTIIDWEDDSIPGGGSPYPVGYGVIFKNTITNRYFFFHSPSEMEAEFQARSACERESYASSCTLLKKEPLLETRSSQACSIKNTITNKFYLGEANSRLEAEFNARAACAAQPYAASCAEATLECTNPAEISLTNECILGNTITNRTYYATGENLIKARFQVQKLCADQSYAASCQAPRCAEVPYSRYPVRISCYMRNTVTNRSYQAQGNTAMEAEAETRKQCQAESYAASCGNLRCDGQN